MPHPANEDLSVSEEGLELIAKHEAFVPTWYLDMVGVWTIGYGTTEAVPGVRREDVDGPISKEEGWDLLRRGLEVAKDCIHQAVDAPLTQCQFEALCSFIYNVGCGAFIGSTLLEKLNAEEYHAAADELLRWVYADGERAPGLVKRRKAERHLFLNERERAKSIDAEPIEGLSPEPIHVDIETLIAELELNQPPSS